MKKTIIITAVGSFSAPAAVKSCREAGYRVVGTDINPREVIAESMSVDRFVRMPRADAGEAYLAAMENEVTSLRMILTGRLAGLPSDTIRERLRECYA
jgi:carbamoylphosphate synthase large subunit